jgi:hypothetical protein
VPEPAAPPGAPGGRGRGARGACLGGRPPPAAVVAGGGVPSVLRWGVASSQVAVPGPGSPVPSVARCVPSRAAGAEGARRRRGAAPASWWARRGPRARRQPPLPPAREGGPLPPPGGRGRRVAGPQPWGAVRAHGLGQRSAGWPRRRPARGRPPPALPLAPRCRDPGWPPRGRGGGQPVPRLAERCAAAREALEGWESGPDRRSGGAWAAVRWEEPLRAPPREPRLAPEAGGLAGEQARAARAQDGGSAARVAHSQGSGGWPVQPRPDGRRRQRRRAPGGTGPHGAERARCRGCRWAPGMGKEGGTGRGRRAGTARSAPPPSGMPLGERGAGPLDGRLRHDVTGPSVQRHREPPRVGCAAIGSNTTPLRHHTGDTRPWTSSTPRMAAIRSLPATSCQEGPHTG